MSFNSQGTYRTTPELMMRAFDKLPPEVRKALAEAPENWVPQPILSAIRRKRWSASRAVAAIHEWSREEAKKHRRMMDELARGPSPDETKKMNTEHFRPGRAAAPGT